MHMGRKGSPSIDKLKQNRKASHSQLSQPLHQPIHSLTTEQNTHSIKIYIESNVKSRRKNMLELYSSTITNPEEGDSRHLQSQMNSNLQLNKNTLSHLQQIQKLRKSQQSDKNMVVSSKIMLKYNEPRSPLHRLRGKSIETTQAFHRDVKKAVSQISPPRKKSFKLKPPLPVLPPLPVIKLKTARVRQWQKVSVKYDINPWQYLMAPDHPYTNSQ